MDEKHGSDSAPTPRSASHPPQIASSVSTSSSGVSLTQPTDASPSFGGVTSVLSKDMSFADVQEEIERTRVAEAHVDQELQQLLTTRTSLEQQISSLISHATTSPDVQLFRGEVQRMCQKIAQTSVFADSLSNKVRSLDKAQSRVKEAVARVDNVLSLKDNVQKIQLSMENGDLDEAAAVTHEVLHKQRPVANDPSFQIIQQQEKTLCERVESEVAKAMKVSPATAESQKVVLRYSKLLPLLGKPFQGLANYCRVCVSSLAAELDAAHLTLRNQPAGAVLQHVDTIVSIFEKSAFCLQKHRDVIEKHFGRGAFLRLLQEVHTQCEHDVSDLLQRFVEDRKLDTLSKCARRAAKKGLRVSTKSAAERKADVDSGPNTDELSAMDSQDLDSLLEEMAYVSEQCQAVDMKLRSMAAAALAQLSENKENEQLLEAMSRDAQHGTSLKPDTLMNRRVQEIIGHYISLEEHAMIRNVQLALDIDQVNEDLTSSLVDDVFFILKKCTKRAFSTYSFSAACAIVNHINSLLSQEYFAIMNTALQQSAPTESQLTQLLSKSLKLSAKDSSKKKLYVTLNNMSVSIDNILTLKDSLEQEFQVMFKAEEKSESANQLDKAGDMVRLCIEELAQVQRQFKSARKTAMISLGNKLAASLMPLMAKFEKTQYDLAQGDHVKLQQQGNPFLAELTTGMQKLLRPMKGFLTEDNLDLLVHSVVLWLVKQLEPKVLKKKFTFWGGLQLDTDIRALLSFFNGMCRKTVRDKFQRLMQISFILQFEKVTEVLDYWDDAGSVLKLKASEVKSVLSLRKDFSKSAINKLKLVNSST